LHNLQLADNNHLQVAKVALQAKVALLKVEHQVALQAQVAQVAQVEIWITNLLLNIL
tara:strand:+ start:134 stop:304 length:171 start_codon:yes stop_codon:yes gene_type:complete